jgi:hypothetical protein
MQNNFTLLKSCILGCFFSLLYLGASAQLTNGGLHANFGVDADTKSDYIKYGSVVGSIRSEDWFSLYPGSKGVIDTSDAAYYKALLTHNENISFVKTMSAPLYTKWNNSLWLDAVYCRDYIKLDSAHLDSTSFTTSCKNAGDPGTWLAGPGGVSNKNDLLDVYTHMRRSGTSITDSLWLFTAASTTGTSGSRYYDIELFKNSFGFDPLTGRFSSPGPDGGHAQWKFDAAGNITETGDLIVAITYNPGNAPIIEVRIWVAKTTFNTVSPALFKFNGQFDANTNSSPFGYASIVSKTGNTAFGAGAGNYTATATDSTFSTPWGTTTSTWNANYQPLQLVEIGLNLTRIGLDPSLYAGLGNQACGSFFKSIFYKSRSSASFSSALNDFVGPLDFMRPPVLDHTIKSDTLSCKKLVGTLRATSNTTAALYQWKTPAGASVAASWLTVNKPGIYILESTIATGCAVGKTDSVVVPIDSLKPVASARMGANMLGQLQLFGGDPVASNYATPFGNSKGLSYSWTGPSAFTSLFQNPLIPIWGQYTITVTELRNGCTSTATVSANLSILSENDLNLKGQKSNNSIKLTWNNSSDRQVTAYEVERSVPGSPFVTIGRVPANNSLASAALTFTDVEPGMKKNLYRIKQIKSSPAYSFSNIVALQADELSKEKFSITNSYDKTKLYVSFSSASAVELNLAIYNMSGQLLQQDKFRVMKGSNTIEVDTRKLPSEHIKVAAIYLGHEILFTGRFW